jgi:PPP family 3-phenylpropionic acid transporter
MNGIAPRRDWWLIRLYYLTVIGAGGGLFPFINLFYQRQGLSGTEIGWLGTIGALTGLISAPLWGRWSDITENPRRLLQIALVGSALLYLLVSFQSIFWWFAVLILLQASISSGTDALSTGLALKQAGSGRFGSVRLWGSLGWAIVVLLAGWGIERRGLELAFWGYAVLVGLSVLLLNGIGNRRAAETNPSNRASLSTLGLLRRITRDRAMLGLAIALTITWLTRLGTYQFEALYMDQLGAGESLIGLSSTVGAVIEIGAMLWADRLVTQRGSDRLLKTTLLLYALMGLGVVLAPAVWMIIAMRALGGFAFSFYSIALVRFIDERAPLGQVTTVLALYTVTLRGLITTVGAPLSGLIYDTAGAYWLYVLAALGSLLAWLILRLTVSGKRSQKRQSSN